ncbi:hypothetical protein DPMN_181121 [Dreissena polymorpha]|uniref:Uncharacterized protein n=1 Tax=Dreissena polymorpha TaxID=45954 RepID=A0A9D4I3E8_DREPO|nr:hypothetical protein DPMN_181121 [Dreissena polymorpha]
MARQRPNRLLIGPCIIEIDQVQYQLEVSRCRKEEIIVKCNFGWVWSTRYVGGAPQVEIDRSVIREVQYQFEFQGSSANSVGGDSGQDGRTDGQTDNRTDGGDNHNVPELFKKRGDKDIRR